MDDKSSSLKLYLLYYSKSEQLKDQWQLSFEDNTYGIFTLPLIYKAGLVTGRKPYGGKINPTKFFKLLEQENHLSKNKGCANQMSQKILKVLNIGHQTPTVMQKTRLVQADKHKIMQFCKLHQTAKKANHRVVPDHYNPS